MGRYQHNPGRYLEKNKVKILGELWDDTVVTVAARHQISVTYFMKTLARWEGNEPEGKKPIYRASPLPDPPKVARAPELFPGKRYRFNSCKLALQYIAAFPGKTPDGFLYLFMEPASGWKESFTVHQLKDDFRGEVGEKWNPKKRK